MDKNCCASQWSFVAVCAALCACTVGRASAAIDQSASFYPLAMGNVWRYRCSAEGEFQFEKRVTIVKSVVKHGKTYYKTEQRTQGKPWVFYLAVDETGKVQRTSQPEPGQSETVAVQELKIGDSLGEKKATREETITTPATGSVRAVVVENFHHHESALTTEQRSNWLGTFFVRGVGVVAEADGLGDECVLIEYTLR